MSAAFTQRRPLLALVIGLLCALPASRPAAAAAPLPPDPIVTAASGEPLWAPGTIRQAQKIKRPVVVTTETAPAMIPSSQNFQDASGAATNFQPGGAVATAGQSFFQPLGTNGRTCQTCHQPAAAWGITPSQIQASFLASLGTAPIFRLVDGAVCPSADISTPQSRIDAYALLLTKGLIRIFLPLPAQPDLQYSVIAVQDPYNCTTDPAYGLTSYGPTQPSQGFVSVYRRPLPTTNLSFLTAVMWDGREPSLASQVSDAVMTHLQAATAPTSDQIGQAVSFEQGLYSAQSTDSAAGSLTGNGATGGPVALAAQHFYYGINDVLGADPTGASFTPDVMTLYEAWSNPVPSGPGPRPGPAANASAAAMASVTRGETLFNEKPITITGVAGLNDALGLSSIPGTCTTCHDAPNVGDHSVKLPINIGVVEPSAAGIGATGLPVFTLRCDAGPLAGQLFTVTDPGKALISGKCADIGKMKGPILRGLAARPPYFHNGSAATLGNVVDFYNNRFAIGLTDQEKADLVAFLGTL